MWAQARQKEVPIVSKNSLLTSNVSNVVGCSNAPVTSTSSAAVAGDGYVVLWFGWFEFPFHHALCSLLRLKAGTSLMSAHVHFSATSSIGRGRRRQYECSHCTADRHRISLAGPLHASHAV